MPPLIVELELWLPPQSDQAPLEGKDVAARCQRETGLAPDVVLGLSFVPDEHDVGTLKRALEEGEVEADEFRSFCQNRGLPSDAEDTQSAAEFVAFTQGQPLAWLHLPAESGGLAMARKLTRWAHENNFQLRDGASTYELLSDAQIYSLWRGAA
jgi:hypothetical protein